MIYDIEDEPTFDNSHSTRRKHKQRPYPRSVKSSLDISTTLELQETPHKECRICLDNEDDTEVNPFIAPCKCTGSVKFVHEKCYRKWIERQYSNKEKRQQLDMLERGVQCEICKERILLEFREKYSCSNKEKLREKCGKNKGLFCLFSFFLLANCSCLGYLSYYTHENSSSWHSTLTTLVMIIVSFAFLGITLMVTAYYFVTDFFVSKVWKLQSFGVTSSKSRARRTSSMQVHPMSIQELPE